MAFWKVTGLLPRASLVLPATNATTSVPDEHSSTGTPPLQRASQMMVAFSKRLGQGRRRDWVKVSHLQNPLVCEARYQTGSNLIQSRALTTTVQSRKLGGASSRQCSSSRKGTFALISHLTLTECSPWTGAGEAIKAVDGPAQIVQAPSHLEPLAQLT